MERVCQVSIPLSSPFPPPCYFLWHVKRTMLFLGAKRAYRIRGRAGGGGHCHQDMLLAQAPWPAALPCEAHPQSGLCVWLWLLEGSQSQSQAWWALLTRKVLPIASRAERKVAVLSDVEGHESQHPGVLLGCSVFPQSYPHGYVLAAGLRLMG